MDNSRNNGRTPAGDLESMRLPLLRFCLKLTGTKWEAEDLVQDTIVRLLHALEAKPGRDIGLRYAYRTARHLWIDRYRRSKRVGVMAQADAAELAGDDGGSHAGGKTRRAMQPAGSSHAAMDAREHLEELAWRLSPKPFVILLLMDVFDFTAKETAAWLGGTEAAVQAALSRARARLKSLSRTMHADGRAPGKREHAADPDRAGASPAFFEAVLDAFRRRHPAAIQQAYLSLAESGGRLRRIRAQGGRLFFTLQDPDGNVLMVST
ncbi:RNA polymerase sigma factor [Paenibacillus sp. GYB003]|uniref:RNA polymerase sigma factor n=1 Tax=Paenibacillus sp. GYB003 TaxID=2994392 RepID=UPI002F96553E